MTSMDIVLPEWPIAEIRRLLGDDAQAWLAGGAVRDLLLEHSPHDWDFVITGSGLRLARAVADRLGGAYYALDAERQTGRAIVADPSTGLRIVLDFARLRQDTILQDLWARDFTLNAMAVDLDGHLIDPTGGLRDLQDRRLRAVSPGCFAADSIRLLRAVRLATQFALILEEATRARIQAEAKSITTTAPERIRAELVALISLPAVASGLSMLAELGLLQHVLPELCLCGCDAHSCPSPDPDETMHRIAVVASLVRLQRSLVEQPTPVDRKVDLARALVQADPELLRALVAFLAEPVGAEVTRGELIRWAALFSSAVTQTGTGVAAIGGADRRMSELRFSRAAIDYVRHIVGSLGAVRQLAMSGIVTKAGFTETRAARRAVYRYFHKAREAGIATAILALAVQETDHTPDPAATRSAYVNTAHVLIEAYLTQRLECIDPPPLLTGHGLLALGVPQGPPVGKMAALLREAQATGEVCTEAQARAFVLRHQRCSEDVSNHGVGEPT